MWSKSGRFLYLSCPVFFFFMLLVVARVVDTLLYPLHFPAYVGIPIKREISFYITFPSNILASDNNYFPLLFSSLLHLVSPSPLQLRFNISPFDPLVNTKSYQTPFKSFNLSIRLFTLRPDTVL